MSMVTYYVGMDYHLKWIQACVMDRRGSVICNIRCPNDMGVLLERLECLGGSVHAAIECSTGSADFAEELISRTGWIVDLAHPGYVSRMKQTPDKSDFTDAQVLADLVRVGYLPRVWLAPFEIRELRRVVRYRQKLVDDQRNTKLRIRALLREQRVRGPECGAWTKAWLHWLTHTQALSEQGRWVMDRLVEEFEHIKSKIRDVHRRLRDMTCEDDVVRTLLGLPGIGWATAWLLRAEVGRFERFRSGKQLSRFCGLSPRNASSGERQADSGLIKAANPQLRATLIQAAHRLRNFDRRWRPLSLRLASEGKKPCVIVAALANRWMRWLYHRMVSEQVRVA